MAVFSSTSGLHRVLLLLCTLQILILISGHFGLLHEKSWLNLRKIILVHYVVARILLTTSVLQVWLFFDCVEGNEKTLKWIEYHFRVWTNAILNENCINSLVSSDSMECTSFYLRRWGGYLRAPCFAAIQSILVCHCLQTVGSTLVLNRNTAPSRWLGVCLVCTLRI